jgi:hypothetical protein
MMKKTTFIVPGILMCLLVFCSCASEPKVVSGNSLPAGNVVVSGNVLNILGMDNLSNVAFYLSKDITLVRMDALPSDIQFQHGVATQITTQAVAKIVIKRKSAGLCKYNKVSDLGRVSYRLIGINFDATLPDLIGFLADSDSSSARFYLAFDDDAAKTIQYEGHTYKVVYSGDERPFLVAKIAKEMAGKAQTVQATGHTF